MCPNPPSSSSSSSSSTSENNFFPTFPKVFQSGPKVCRKVQHGLKHFKCWFGPLWDTFGPFWVLLEGCFQGTDAEDKQGVPQRVLEKNFQHKSCSLITYWWEHLEQLQTRIEAIDEPHPMHIRSLCAGLTPLLTSAPMVNIIRWPVVVGHWLIRSVVWHGQHHQMLQLSDTNRDTQWWLVTAHPCWAFLSFTCCREMKSTFLFGVPQVTEVLQLTQS